MNVQSKIQLSDFEMGLLTNPEWILTKNGIMKKAQILLEQVQVRITEYAVSSASFHPDVLSVPPKISRGENYLGLPWLILDFPRHFVKENIFAIRTMFWWGHHFTTTLHLSGKYRQEYLPAIIANYPKLREDDFYVCIHEDQWHHHLETDNYVPLKELSKEKLVENTSKTSFIKLSKRLDLKHWKDASILLTENFEKLARWLN